MDWIGATVKVKNTSLTLQSASDCSHLIVFHHNMLTIPGLYSIAIVTYCILSKKK